MIKLYRSMALGAFLFSASFSTVSSGQWMKQANAQLQIAVENSDYEVTDIVKAFSKQGIRISKEEAQKIKENVLLALSDAKQYGIGNSKVDFAAIEIAQDLELDISAGSNSVKNIVSAVDFLLKNPPPAKPKTPPPSWLSYYNKTLSLISDATFNQLVSQAGFSPVKISWEDIGRHANSSWGDRISDVGIWVRRDEKDPQSASLAMSVRRDNNFRDKVLMVPSDKIKIHRQVNGKTEELTLTERLAELKLSSPKRDRNVIVSNQFAVVPVPAKDMAGAWKKGEPPRAAFNFSIYPYGSTNYVITDVIEGSSEAIVGPGNHQYLYANIDGKKAPFTASRAEDRQDLLKLEAELKAQGMDVDVQRYYLIQIPLKKNAKNIQLSNLGTPNMARGFAVEGDGLGGGSSFGLGGLSVSSGSGGSGYGSGLTTATSMPKPAPAKAKNGKPNKTTAVPTTPVAESQSAPLAEPQPLPSAPSVAADVMEEEVATNVDTKKEESKKEDPTAGLTKVAIGHGDAEGDYFGGSGFENQRSDEPVRVTVVYFVTPVSHVTQKDMESFTKAFQAWDSQAIWGGSFVTKESGF